MPAAPVYSILSKKENAHEDSILCCVWANTNVTGDSKVAGIDFLITGGLDCLVKVWQIENNKLQLFHTLDGHCMAVVSIAISPDGHTIASTSLDSTLIIWELVSGLKVHEIETKATDVWKVAFSPDGTQVATGGHTGKIIVYGIEKGMVDRVLDTRGKFAMSIAWSPDGKYISCGSVSGTVCVVDVCQAKVVHSVDAHRDSIRDVAFSRNSKLLATASHDGSVHVYDVASATLQHKLDHKWWAVSVCFSPDGTRLATAAGDGCVRIVHLTEMNVLHAFHEHSDVAWSVKFNTNGTKCVSVSKDKSIVLYECPLPAKEVEKKKQIVVK